MGQYDDMPAPPMPAPVDSGFSEWPPAHWGMSPAIAQALAPPAPPPIDQPGLGGIPATALDAAAAAPPAPPPGTPVVTVGDPTGGPIPQMPGALPQPATNPDQPPGFGTPAWMQAGQPPSGSFPPPNPDQPDAISGAGFPGSDAEADHDKITDLDGDRVKSAEFYAKHPWDNPNVTEAQAGVNALSPEDRAEHDRQREAAAQTIRNTEELKALAHQQEIAQRNYQTRVDADAAATKQAAQVDADAKALAAKQIDPERWWNSRSTGQKISGYIAAIAGGLASPQFGGRNIGLEQINKAIDQDTEAQKANIQNAWKGIEHRKGAVADLFERNRNSFQAAETFRIASYDMVEKQLAIEQQNYDTRGQTYSAIAATRAGVAAQRATALEGLRRNAFDEYIKSGDLATKQYEAETHRQAEIDKANKLKGGLGGTPQYGKVYASLDDIPAKERKLAYRLPSKNGVPGGWVIANNEKTAEEATNLTSLYSKADYDANELEKISLRRKGAMNAAGGFNKDWKDTDEQHYESLLLDLANTYGMMIHGRAPTAGVLDEVMTKAAPELKPFWKSGDTTALLDHFRNDIDNRTTLQLQAYGNNGTVTSDRPKTVTPNANSIKAPLVAAPVKGEGGYAHMSVADFDGQLKQLFDHHLQNPSLGGQKGYEADLADIEHKQDEAIVKITGDLTKLTAKPKKTPQDNAQIRAATAAIADRAQAIDAIHDARKRSIEHARNEAAQREANKKTIIQGIRHR